MTLGFGGDVCVWTSSPPHAPMRQGLTLVHFRLNLSAFRGVGVHSGVVQGVVEEVSVGSQEYEGVFRVCFVSETAEVELRSERV